MIIEIMKIKIIQFVLKFKSQRIVFIKITVITAFSSYIYYGIILNLGKMKGNFF